MSEENTPNEPVEETGKGLRAQLEKSIASGHAKDEENAALKTQLLAGAYANIGLDPSKELGKAIAKEYQGEPTVEGLTKFAFDEYGYTKPAGEAHPQAAAIAQGQAQVDAASQGAGSAPIAPTDAERLAEAEAKGDYQTTMAIKGAQIAAQFQGR